MLSTEQLLQKAILQTETGSSDFGGAGQAPLSVEQVTAFIELMTAEQAMLPSVRTVTSNAALWQESIVEFSGRIMKPGTQGTRLASGDRTKPDTDKVEIVTSLVRAEVPVTDEVWEDQVAGEGFRSSIERLIANRAGYDLEELFINGDTLSGDPYLALTDGWLKIAEDSGVAVDATSYGEDYQEIFRVMLQSMEDRFKRNLVNDGCFWVPVRVEEKWRDILSSRGTALGDMMLTGANELRYQSIRIKGVPNFAITAGSPDTSKILLCHNSNLYAGYQRKMRFETFRDPREGAISFIVTARVDAEIAVPSACVLAYDVNVEI